MSAKFLNTKNLMTAFAVSHMTIHHWRKGSESKAPLPTVAVKDQPKAVAFSPSQIKAWAKKHKIELAVADLDSLIGAEADAKPGPKAKAKAKAPAKVVKASPAAKKTAKGAVKPAAKKASPLKGTKVSAKLPEVKLDTSQPRLRVIPAELKQAA